MGRYFVLDSVPLQRYNETRERIPANVTGAITGPDRDIYFFRGDKFTKRPLHEHGVNKSVIIIIIIKLLFYTNIWFKPLRGYFAIN